MNDSTTELTTLDRSRAVPTIFSLVPKTLQEAMEFAKIISDTDFVPKDYRNKPGNILVAVQMGAEVGLPPMQALQGIAVINGRPSIWGDAMWALVKNSTLCEWTDETFDDASMTATCMVKRRGSPVVVRTFSKSDAEKAQLWGKDTYKQYPRRMLQMRARAYACRDALPEVLKGLSSREEAADIRDMGDAEREPILMPQAREELPLPDGRRVTTVQHAGLHHGIPASPSPATTEKDSAESDASSNRLPAGDSGIDMSTGEIRPPAGNGGGLMPGQMNILRADMRHYKVDDVEIVHKFGVPLEQVPFAKFAEVRKFICGGA